MSYPETEAGYRERRKKEQAAKPIEQAIGEMRWTSDVSDILHRLMNS